MKIQSTNRIGTFKTLGLCGLALALSACASSGVDYVPAAESGDVGYSEQQISADRYRVNFIGDDSTSLENVQDFALLRAAELTVQKNYDWFRVADRTTIPVHANTPDGSVEIVSTRPTHTNCGLLGCETHYAGEFATTGAEVPRGDERYSTNLEIVMGSGSDTDAENTYNARDVIETIRARI